MFRRGFDTHAISQMLEIDEASIERMLHAAMAVERFKEGSGATVALSDTLSWSA
jgi:hypothetical protein